MHKELKKSIKTPLFFPQSSVEYSFSVSCMATTKGTAVADKLTGVLIIYKYFKVYLSKGAVSRDWIGPCIVLLDRP